MKMFQDKKFIENINICLKNGGVIGFVTDTVWGIGCLPTSEAGVKKIYEIKNRDPKKPLILLSNSSDNLQPYTKGYSEQGVFLIDKYWPGALTIITEKSSKTPDFVSENTIGVRVPNNETFSKLCEIIEGHVLATTSANHSGDPSALSFDDVMNSVGNDLDYVIPDFDNHAAGIESTVVSVIDNKIKILRQGCTEL